MTMHELAEQYKEQADILRQKMNNCIRYPMIDDKEYAKYMHYKAMYEDVLYAYKNIMRYTDA